MTQSLRLGSQGKEVASVQAWLRRFGYFSRDRGAPQPLADANLAILDSPTASALRRFQRFYGLPETGEVDAATAHVMSLPRCGFPDLAEFAVDGRRWNTNNLTYAINNTPAGLSIAQVQAAIRDAFSLWSAVTPLRFTEVPAATAHDIDILFAAGNHGDGDPFDGPGNVLAHAFFPPPNNGALAGDAHFDAAETWTVVIPVPTGTFDLVTVAAHEFGDSLGLRHSNVGGALMFPTYSGAHRFLAADDVDGIRSIYGSGFLLQTGTCLHETDDSFAFAVASNGDLFAIKKRNTGTHTTEIHIISAATNYQQFSLQTGTALHETDADFQFALAPNRDVVAIKTRNTGSHSTEVHVLSAASNYQQFSLQTGTALHETDTSFAFRMAQNRDLVVIKRRATGTNSTEVHVLSVSSNYQQFSLQTGTALHETDATFDFALAANGDLFAVKKQHTGTASTEVHVLSAGSGYRQFVLQTGTALHETDATFAFDVTSNRDLFAVKKANTGTHTTEVHIVDL